MPTLLFSHLQLPFISFGLNNCLWSHLHFDHRNIQRHLRIAELGNISSHFDQAFLAIWELGFARKNVRSATKELFRSVAEQLGVDTRSNDDPHVSYLSQLSAIVTKLIGLLSSLTPPQKLMDPPHFVHLQQLHWHERLQHVAVYVDALQMFLQLTNAKSYDIDQIIKICCSVSSLSPFSSAPILRQICANHRDISSALRRLDAITVASNECDDSDQSFKYRCCWTEGQESDYANHFQHEFVDRFRNATAHLTQTIGRVVGNAFTLLRTEMGTTRTNCGTEQFHAALENAQNVLSTISTLKALITTTPTTAISENHSSLAIPMLFVYPDLVTPYLHVLNLLSIALSEFCRMIGIALNAQHICHKHGFLKPVYNAFNQLLHSFSLHNSKSLAITESGNANDTAVFSADVQPFIRWLITSDQKCCPLTISDRLPLCLWAFSVFPSCQSQCQRDVLDWILNLWERWHEENARIKAEEQLVVVKRKRKTKQIDETEVEGDECVQMESDEQKLRAAYLPDFSNATNDSEPVGNHSSNGGTVDDDQLFVSKNAIHDALCNVFQTLSNQEQTENCAAGISTHQQNTSSQLPPFLPLLSVFDKLELYLTGNQFDHHDEILLFPQLLLLAKLRDQLQFHASSSGLNKFPSFAASPPAEASQQTLNVYRDSDPSALIHCVQCLEPLYKRVQQLLAEFPENGQLATLCSTIDTFVHKAPAGAPLMKHAAQLENILVRAEEWESIADRAHSIRPQMVQLQELLVEWRRREVHCWAGLVNMMRADCAQLAVLTGWPLFKCAMDTLRDDAQQQQQNDAGTDTENNTLILAFVDWMHNASVGDFDARLWTGHLLTKCLHVLAPPNSMIGDTLCRRMHSTCAHFAQFSQAVQAHFSDRFAPVERSLSDFCRAVRYTDLNVWSVQDSARRAHTHLVRILRSFKNMNDEPIFPLLFEKPSPPLEWVEATVAEHDSVLAQQVEPVHQQQQAANGNTTTTLLRFVSRLDASIVRMLGGMDAMDGLRTDAIAMLSELQMNIVYESADQRQQSAATADHKPGDQEAIQSVNEKRHGRALFVRQQQLARLVRAAEAVGLNARRAQHIDSEQLTMQTVTETTALQHMSDTIGTHFRHSTAARNVFLRQFAKFRRHNSNQQQQLTPANLQQLRNIVEHALHWMHGAITALGHQQRFGDAHRRALHIARCIALEAKNAADALANSGVDDVSYSSTSHACLSDLFVQNGRLISTLSDVIDRMRQLHQICPRQLQNADSDADHQQQQQSYPTTKTTCSLSTASTLCCTALQTPLGLLRQPSTEHAELDAELSSLEPLLQRLKRCHCDVEKGSVRLPNDAAGHFRIWNRSMWRTYIECIISAHGAFSELSSTKLRDYFVDEFAMLSQSFDQLLLANKQQLQQQQRQTVQVVTNNDHQQPEMEFECVEKAVLLYLQSICKEIEQYGDSDSSAASASSAAQCLLERVKRVLEFVNKLNSDKALTQLYDWFLLNSSINISAIPGVSPPLLANRLANAHTLVCGLSSALCRLQHHIGTFVVQLASFHAHWSAVGCHLLTNGFVNPIPIMDRQNGAKEAEGERVEAGDGFGDGDLAPNATDVSSQVENMEQIEGLKESGSDQKEQQMDDQDGGDQSQQQQQQDKTDQPIDVEDDFAARLEGLDAGEGDEEGIDAEDGDQQQREDIEDRADLNFEEVEDSEETQLNPELPKGDDDLREQDSNMECESDQKEQQMDEQNGGDQSQQQQQQDKTNQPIDVEDDFAARLEGLDAGDGSEEGIGQPKSGRKDAEGGDQQQPEAIEDRANLNSVEVDNKCTKESGNDQKEQQMDDQNGGDQSQQQQQQGETNQPIDVKDDFAARFGGLDSGEGEQQGIGQPKAGRKDAEGGDQQQPDAIEDRADLNSVEVEDSEETQLIPELRKQPEGEANFREQDSNMADQPESGSDQKEQQMDEQICGDRSQQQQQQGETDQPIDVEEVVSDRLEEGLQQQWALITDTVAPLAAELAESLRAIIEPTVASRLEGDYRTGKRLNMRRLIPYIASDYRKDRIWMRRTRKARRNYQICIAVDNSQSMQHNHMTEITCNALCLIERALRQLEVGQLALCSFGSQVQLIADFAASEHDFASVSGAVPLGVRILQQLRFDQSRTDLGQLLDVAKAMFARAREGGSHQAVDEQLLIILGDGRGVFSEGTQRIRQAISRLYADRVTVLFLIMDVPPPVAPQQPSSSASTATSHKSIMDMRIADFSADGQTCTFRSYMSQFPFPLYALVRDTHTVPATVAEAVRQWFEQTATG